MLCDHLFRQQEMGRKLEEISDCLLHAPVYTQTGRVSLRWRKNRPPRAKGFSSRDFPGPEARTGRVNRDYGYGTGILVVTKKGFLDRLLEVFRWRSWGHVLGDGRQGTWLAHQHPFPPGFDQALVLPAAEDAAGRI